MLFFYFDKLQEAANKLKCTLADKRSVCKMIVCYGIFLLLLLLNGSSNAFSPYQGSKRKHRSQAISGIPCNGHQTVKDNNDRGDNFFSTHLVESLDLEQVINDVAKHTGSRRGYEALLSLVQRKSPRNGFQSEFQNNNRRFTRMYNTGYDDHLQHTTDRDIAQITRIAKSVEEAQYEYRVVEEAMSLVKNNDHGISDLTYPPLYGEDSSPYDVDTIPLTDDDEWLYLPVVDYEVEHILQVEQVVKNFLQIRRWSESIQAVAPELGQIAATIDNTLLSSLYEEVAGNVEIKSFKLVGADPSTGKASYSVQINDNNYPILGILRKKEANLIKKGGKELDKDVVAIRNEIEELTAEIVSGLAQKVQYASKNIVRAFEVAARLDVLFAKAAYAVSLNGVVPLVLTHGNILIEDFLHPILLKSMGTNDEGAVVPIDLRLSSETTGERALVISGPNGGGKTLAMKSFGLVATLIKLGIPIPIKKGGKRPRVDYFDEIFVNIGDKQNILDGESSWTSILNSCARMIETIDKQLKDKKNSSHIVLLDELGTGTDPESGGAVAQAILEELIVKSCKVVVTTHLPRLKALSYASSSIGCAAVLLDYNDNSTFRRPSFQLHYDLIGESHALNAASRCVPSLPDSILTRASNLMDTGMDVQTGTHENYIEALSNSMEEQLKRTKHATSLSEKMVDELFRCRRAMVSLARSYECHLDRRLDILETSFQNLKADKSNDLELIGNTISELKVVKKKITDKKQMLIDKGLRVLPPHYTLHHGETVVILSNDKWEGVTAEVLLREKSNVELGTNEVMVKPSWSLNAWDDVRINNVDPMEDRPLILQRHELAIWNLDSLDDYDDTYKSKPATSISDSKRKVNSLLSTLSSLPSTKEGQVKKKRNNTYQSSRNRKAANKGKKKRK